MNFIGLVGNSACGPPIRNSVKPVAASRRRRSFYLFSENNGHPFRALDSLVIEFPSFFFLPTDPADSEVKFDARGDGLARYTIMNYRRLPNSANGYDYKVRTHTHVIEKETAQYHLFFYSTITGGGQVVQRVGAGPGRRHLAPRTVGHPVQRVLSSLRHRRSEDHSAGERAIFQLAASSAVSAVSKRKKSDRRAEEEEEEERAAE